LTFTSSIAEGYTSSAPGLGRGTAVRVPFERSLRAASWRRAAAARRGRRARARARRAGAARGGRPRALRRGGGRPRACRTGGHVCVRPLSQQPSALQRLRQRARRWPPRPRSGQWGSPTVAALARAAFRREGGGASVWWPRLWAAAPGPLYHAHTRERIPSQILGQSSPPKEEMMDS